MPNHFHILLTPAVEEGIQLFMQKLATSYSMYFNKRYERTGGLFEGRFKSQHVDSDEYLKYLFSYVHLNPAKLIFPEWKDTKSIYTDKIKEYVSKFEYSSLRDYLQAVAREEVIILNKDKFPEYFTTPDSWINELETWLEYDNITLDLGPA
jgi:putative transposase